MESDDDDDIPQLSAETFAALKEFYKEEDDREVLKSEAGGKNHVASCDMNIFSEDWNLSQFWYSEETSKTLAKECLRCVGPNGSIACISAPSVYVAIKKHFPEATNQVVLLEYDKRFSGFGEDFIFYDYKNPLGIPRHLASGFDLVFADPPFLSDECLTKTAVTVKFMAKEKIILCTGAVMQSMAKKLLNLDQCTYEPKHTKNLANEFRCYTNYDFDNFICG